MMQIFTRLQGGRDELMQKLWAGINLETDRQYRPCVQPAQADILLSTTSVYLDTIRPRYCYLDKLFNKETWLVTYCSGVFLLPTTCLSSSITIAHAVTPSAQSKLAWCWTRNTIVEHNTTPGVLKSRNRYTTPPPHE